jgi:uncharacterized membrane protein HdeD (DUF308 family)
MDRWDLVGLAGAVLIGGGVWALSRPAWASVVWGSMLLAVYVAREMRAAGR